MGKYTVEFENHTVNETYLEYVEAESRVEAGVIAYLKYKDHPKMEIVDVHDFYENLEYLSMDDINGCTITEFIQAVNVVSNILC